MRYTQPLHLLISVFTQSKSDHCSGFTAKKNNFGIFASSTVIFALLTSKTQRSERRTTEEHFRLYLKSKSNHLGTDPQTDRATCHA